MQERIVWFGLQHCQDFLFARHTFLSSVTGDSHPKQQLGP
jgi:hypothetical protein